MPHGSTRIRRLLVGAFSGALLVGFAACDDTDFNNAVILANRIRIVSGDGQTGTAGQPLANPLVVQVLDRNSNSAGNVVVTWTAFSGTVSSTQTTTDIDGTTSVTWTPAGGGADSVRAAVTSDGLGDPFVTGGFVTFHATVTP
ncbi:MAG TPA: Ig-like domain-containing protein [Gemmatimonadaceae bacterium]